MFHPHEVLQNIHQVKYNLHPSLPEQVHLFLYLTIDLPYRYRLTKVTCTHVYTYPSVNIAEVFVPPTATPQTLVLFTGIYVGLDTFLSGCYHQSDHDCPHPSINLTAICKCSYMRWAEREPPNCKSTIPLVSLGMLIWDTNETFSPAASFNTW